MIVKYSHYLSLLSVAETNVEVYHRNVLRGISSENGDGERGPQINKHKGLKHKKLEVIYIIYILLIFISLIYYINFQAPNQAM